MTPNKEEDTKFFEPTTKGTKLRNPFKNLLMEKKTPSGTIRNDGDKVILTFDKEYIALLSLMFILLGIFVFMAILMISTIITTIVIVSSVVVLFGAAIVTDKKKARKMFKRFLKTVDRTFK